MRVTVESRFPCTREHLWQRLRKVSSWTAVSDRVIVVTPVDPAALPEEWCAGDRILIRQSLIHLPFLPAWNHLIEVVSVDESTHSIHTRESGEGVKSWEHEMSIREDAGGEAIYRDSVEIKNGLMTLPVWFFAQTFYRHRHWRWRRLLKSGAL